MVERDFYLSILLRSFDSYENERSELPRVGSGLNESVIEGVNQVCMLTLTGNVLPSTGLPTSLWEQSRKINYGSTVLLHEICTFSHLRFEI